MEAFLTPEQRALRQSVRDYFRRRPAPDTGEGAGETAAAAGALSGWLAKLAETRVGILERAIVVEEVSAVSPPLGRALVPSGDQTGLSPAEMTASEIAVSLGRAAGVLEACQRAAREKGFFESTLMDHQRAQMRLADVLSGLEAARLQAYRAFSLLDRGDSGRGERELARAAERASRVGAAARDLAAALLASDWLERGPEMHERSRS